MVTPRKVACGVKPGNELGWPGHLAGRKRATSRSTGAKLKTYPRPEQLGERDLRTPEPSRITERGEDVDERSNARRNSPSDASVG